MGKFSDILGAGSGLIGTGLGLLLQKHNDRRQIKQQEKLQELQMRGEREMGQYNMKLQKEMWDATNYEAQMKHIKAAGLNPGLLYGKGGGGGVTAGAISENVTGGQAPIGGKEVGMGIQMAQQAALMASQIEVNKSIANKNNTEATKAAGVDTQQGLINIEQTKTNIEQLKASTSNIKAQEALTKVQKAIADIEQMTDADVYDKGYYIQRLGAEVDLINQEAVKIGINNWISNKTHDDVVRMIKANTETAIIETSLKRAQVNVTNEQVNQIKQVIAESKKSIEQKTASITELLSKAGLMDKEKSLLTAQTIIQGLGTVGGIISGLKKKGGNLNFETHNHIPAAE